MTVRKTRGDDIDAACGQLAGEIQDRTRVQERTQKLAEYQKKYGKDFLHVSKIKLKVVEKNNKTSVCITFKTDIKKSNNIKNMYIGLYFKKIFYRFKQYFE